MPICSDNLGTIIGNFAFCNTQEAGYSHIYASKAAHMQDGGASKGMQSDEREFMLVSLLVGAEIEMDRDAPGLTEACKGLRTPPSVSGCQTKPSLAGDGVPACAAPPQPVPGHKYNTVRGYTQTDQRQANGSWQKNASCPRSRVWIVYENGRAYPQYLIRYYRGAFSSDRLLYRNREEAAELQNAKGGGKQASLDAFGETTRLVPLDSLDRRLPLPAFCHVNPDGSTTPYESRQNEIIAEARSLNKPSVRLEDVHLADGTCMKFEVRFGAQAVSRKLRTSPSSGMIQVNLENENTRVVLEI